MTSNAPQAVGTAPTEELIRQLAYRRWEEAGCPPGDGVDFWVRAERELLGTTAQPNG